MGRHHHHHQVFPNALHPCLKSVYVFNSVSVCHCKSLQLLYFSITIILYIQSSSSSSSGLSQRSPHPSEVSVCIYLSFCYGKSFYLGYLFYNYYSIYLIITIRPFPTSLHESLGSTYIFISVSVCCCKSFYLVYFSITTILYINSSLYRLISPINLYIKCSNFPSSTQSSVFLP